MDQTQAKSAKQTKPTPVDKAARGPLHSTAEWPSSGLPLKLASGANEEPGELMDAVVGIRGLATAPGRAAAGAVVGL